MIIKLQAENRRLHAQLEALKKNPFTTLGENRTEDMQNYKCQGIGCRGAVQCERYDPFGHSSACGAFWLRRDDLHSEFCDAHIAKVDS